VIDGEFRRKRYNLPGSRGHGVETGLDWLVDDGLTLRGHVGWQELTARGGERSVLYQRPEREAALSVDWSINRHWSLFVEVRHVGGAFDVDEAGELRRLPNSNVVDFRVFREFLHNLRGRWQLYASADNVTDELVLPQLGLPLPGRSASIGITFQPEETQQ